MENASKALIIAGAILLAILLISLGILIFNQAQDTVNNSGMSQAEITAFNNRFLKYEGVQKGSVVKSLINEIFAANADDNLTQKIKINAREAGSDDYSKTSTFKTTKEYTVKLHYDKGMVCNVEINPTEGDLDD